MDERRRAQVREHVRHYRQKMREKGIRQHSFYMTEPQAAAVRAWLQRGGDVSILSTRGDK
ncbi:hypothetical protein BAE30_16375 [Acidithiobacillus caldus]|uniref:Uncharacterized protein n=1 Tax=Acidithiobacillus caldus TaxID=33059 RepID=A0A1E7YRP3_9PROT|nr:hypothetical protein BAE30_16375 [Acidithiobacillus caldus]